MEGVGHISECGKFPTNTNVEKQVKCSSFVLFVFLSDVLVSQLQGLCPYEGSIGTSGVVLHQCSLLN